MKKASASACGKVILFGEHSVVYGFPAIAAPIKECRTIVDVTENDKLKVESKDFEDTRLLEEGAMKIIEKLDINNYNIKLNVSTSIPVASGLGSSASFSVAATRAIAEFFGKKLNEKEIAEASYEAESIFHGKASGIDNTVVAYEKPIYFVKEKEPEVIELTSPFSILIADTGIRSKTAEVVKEVKERYEQNKELHEAIFYDIESTVKKAKVALENGYITVLGKLMNENQSALERLNVSLPAINDIIDEAKKAGALGAKISGAGKGGNVIILAHEDKCEEIKHALRNKAKNVMIARVE